jgi:hypothetical protein
MPRSKQKPKHISKQPGGGKTPRTTSGKKVPGESRDLSSQKSFSRILNSRNYSRRQETEEASQVQAWNCCSPRNQEVPEVHRTLDSQTSVRFRSSLLLPIASIIDNPLYTSRFSFQRLVREIAVNYQPDPNKVLRFQRASIEVLQEACEN